MYLGVLLILAANSLTVMLDCLSIRRTWLT